MKVLKYSRYSFLKEANLITEDSEFQQFQFGIEPMGTAGGGGDFAFAMDPGASYYNYQDSPYTDFYARQSGLVSNLDRVIKSLRGQNNLIYKDSNPFLEDIELYDNIKILRIYENNSLKLDVFISFEFDKEEYFGVFRNYNGLIRPTLESEVYFDPEYLYRFDSEYKLKLSNYFYKKLEKWFIPDQGFYKNMKNETKVKNNIGKLYEINENKVVEILGYNINSNNKPYIIMKVNEDTYHIENNDYYYFKWRFEKMN